VNRRVRGARTVAITKNETLTGLNKPKQLTLAVVILDPHGETVHYVRTPFEEEPGFKAMSVNFDLAALLALAQEPA
jgi:hypothetical protein